MTLWLLFAAMTSWALLKHQRKPCPESSHPEKANKRGNHQQPCTKQLQWLHRYGTQTRMSWSARVMSALLPLCSAEPPRRHPVTDMIAHCGDTPPRTNQESCFPQCQNTPPSPAPTGQTQQQAALSARADGFPPAAHLVTSSHCCLWSFSSTT